AAGDVGEQMAVAHQRQRLPNRRPRVGGTVASLRPRVAIHERKQWPPAIVPESARGDLYGAAPWRDIFTKIGLNPYSCRPDVDRHFGRGKANIGAREQSLVGSVCFIRLGRKLPR